MKQLSSSVFNPFNISQLPAGYGLFSSNYVSGMYFKNIHYFILWQIIANH